MVLKSISHKSSSASSIRKLVQYVFEKEKLQDRFFNRKPIISKQFLRSYDKAKWVSQIKENDNARVYNHKNRTVLRHEIIAFGKQDNRYLAREVLKDFIQFYFKHRSPQSMQLAGVHYEESVHIHFIIAAVDVNGNSTRISRDGFKDFKIQLQRYQIQKYPELSHSVVDFNKTKRLRLKITEKEKQMNRNRVIVSDKRKLSMLVSKLASQSISLEELAEKLKQHNLKPYYRYGLLAGIWATEKTKLRLTTLGVGKQHLKELTLEQKRLNSLKKVRDRKSKDRERGR